MPFAAIAQTNARPDPADPKVARAARYESPFAGYRPFSDEKVVSWRATNELVLKLGGWRAFAQDKVPDIPAVTEPADAPGQKGAGNADEPAKKPASNPHTGHR